LQKLTELSKHNRGQLLPKTWQLAACLLFLFIANKSISQNNSTPTAIWLLPGISYQDSSRVKLLLQYCLNSRQEINAVYLQAFIKAGRNIIINPAYLYLNFPGTKPHVQEHTFMNAIIVSFPLGKMILDDRNLIWNRFRRHADDFHLYRNRLRLNYPFSWQSFKLYAFDEVFYLFNQHSWTRNRIAFGCSMDFTSSFNADIFYAREYDSINGRMNLVFIITTFQFHKKKKSRLLSQ